LKETVKNNRSRPYLHDVFTSEVVEEKIARLKAEYHMLRAKNELLKNIE